MHSVCQCSKVLLGLTWNFSWTVKVIEALEICKKERNFFSPDIKVMCEIHISQNCAWCFSVNLKVYLVSKIRYSLTYLFVCSDNKMWVDICMACLCTDQPCQSYVQPWIQIFPLCSGFFLSVKYISSIVEPIVAEWIYTTPELGRWYQIIFIQKFSNFYIAHSVIYSVAFTEIFVQIWFIFLRVSSRGKYWGGGQKVDLFSRCPWKHRPKLPNQPLQPPKNAPCITVCWYCYCILLL